MYCIRFPTRILCVAVCRMLQSRGLQIATVFHTPRRGECAMAAMLSRKTLNYNG
ncbi:hypothetical protein E2C01_063280 [Portunus trituberculatus]|uniref:Uncharacterized protein n=1 Tax=Portunus trituberculatus TaxID=210409 RepID=A0A5B7HGM7_PORTR|nr:hypothetical protein [Portunus trituberculatus]